MTSSQSSAHARNAGLDLFRATAITLVLFGHWMQHADPLPWMQKWLGWGGVPGVELFFVLSGFLIGGIIIREVDRQRFQLPTDLAQFWVRRWMRTLPLYFFFLLIWLKVDWRGPFSWAQYPEYFIFLQNFTHPTPAFFELSWSLAVEEWFYLLYPLTLLVLIMLGMRARLALVATTVIFMVATPILRWVVLEPRKVNDLVDWLRIPVIFRLDSLMYGVGMAIIAKRLPRLWPKLAKTFPIWLGLFLLFQYLCITRMDELLASPPLRTLLFSIFSLSAALLIPRATFLQLGNKPLLYFVSVTSKLSYSIYLGHIVVIIFVNRALNEWLGEAASELPWYLIYSIYAVATYGLAAITYRLIESPFLQWRDRISWLSDRTRSASGVAQ